ncbi:MAG: hypothetical protein ACT4QG_21980 [Sporichthyaceae bacterium]
MGIVTRAAAAVGVVAALAFVVTPADANAASADRCVQNYSGTWYCDGKPYQGWSRYHDDGYYDDDYGYYEDGDDYYGGQRGGYRYGGRHYEEYPLVCGETRYSCRAPRRP